MKILLRSIYNYAFSVLILFIPFEDYIRALPNILLGVLAISFPFIVHQKDFNKLKNVGSYFFFGLFLFIVITTLIFDRWDDNFHIIKKLLIAIVLVIFFLPVKDVIKINRAIIFSSLLAIGFSLFNIVVLVNNTGAFDFGDNQNPLNTLLIDRLYLGLLCLMSILVSCREITNGTSAFKKFHILNCIVSIAFLFLIVSKIAIITLLLVALLRLLYKKIRLTILLASIGFFAIILTAAVLANGNLSTRFLYKTSNSSNVAFVEHIMQREPRAKIWECGYLIAKQESVLISGIGFKSTNEALLTCYNDHIENEGRKGWFLLQKYNTHNQFLDFFLSTGFISFILFLGIFIAFFLRHRRHFFPTALLLSLFLLVCVESLFHRQIGAFYFGIVMIYLIFYTNRANQANITEIDEVQKY